MFKKEVIQFNDIIKELRKEDPELAQKLWDEFQERKNKPRKEYQPDIIPTPELAQDAYDTKFKVQFIDRKKVLEELKKLERESK